jgi:hypothetical protein
MIILENINAKSFVALTRITTFEATDYIFLGTKEFSLKTLHTKSFCKDTLGNREGSVRKTDNKQRVREGERERGREGERERGREGERERGSEREWERGWD